MPSPLPSLESLRCFVEVARLSNFRAAARVVALTPAAVGQRVKQLEEELGSALFHRTTRRVVLTDAGLRLLPHARHALQAADTCRRAARGDLGPPPLDLVLGTRHELGLSWIVPLLPRLRAAQPGLTLHLYFGSGPDLLLRVRTAEVDCAVTSSVLTDPKLTSIRLHEERYVLVGARRLLSSVPFRSPSDAAKHTLVDISAEQPLFHYFRSSKSAPESLSFGSLLRMGTIASIRDLVLAGEGVAVLPEYYVRDDLARRRLLRVLPRVKLMTDHFRLIHRVDDPRASVYQAMAATMKAAPLR